MLAVLTALALLGPSAELPEDWSPPPAAAYIVVVDGLILADLVDGAYPALTQMAEASEVALVNSRTRSDSYTAGVIHRRAYLIAAGAGRRLRAGSSGSQSRGGEGPFRAYAYTELQEGEPYGTLAAELRAAGRRAVLGADEDGPSDPDAGLLVMGEDHVVALITPQDLADLPDSEAANLVVALALSPDAAEAAAPALRETSDQSGSPIFVLSMPPRGADWSAERMGLFWRYGVGQGLLGCPTTRRPGLIRIASVCPTVLDTLGLPAPLDIEGRPAWNAPAPPEGVLRRLEWLMDATRNSERGRTAQFRTLMRNLTLVAWFAIAAWPLAHDDARRRLLRFLGLLALAPVTTLIACFKASDDGSGVVFVAPPLELLRTLGHVVPGADHSVGAHLGAACTLGVAGLALVGLSMTHRPRSGSASAPPGVDDLMDRAVRGLGLGLLLAPAVMALMAGANPSGDPWRLMGSAALLAAGAGLMLTLLPWRRASAGLACAFSPAVFLGDQLMGANLAAFSFFGYCLSRDSRLYGIGNSMSIVTVVGAVLLAGLLADAAGRRRWLRVAAWTVTLVPVVIIGAPSLGANTGGLLTAAFASSVALGLAVGGAKAVLVCVVGGPLVAAAAVLGAGFYDIWAHGDPTTHLGHFLNELFGDDREFAVRTLQGKVRLVSGRFTTRLWWASLGTTLLFAPWVWAGAARNRRPDAPPLSHILAGMLISIFAGLVNDSGSVMTAMGFIPCAAAAALYCARTPANEPDQARAKESAMKEASA